MKAHAILLVSFLLLAYAGFRSGAHGADAEMGGSAGVELSWMPSEPGQGDVVQLWAQVPEGLHVRRAQVSGVPVYFVPLADRPGIWNALYGVDAEMKPGRYEVVLSVAGPGASEAGESVVRRKMRIVPRRFEEERLTLPPSMVTLSKENLARVERENRVISSLWTEVSPQRLWDSPFVLPLSGGAGSSFGLRRIINGEPRSSHSGRDLKAPEGTPVKASNGGRVALAGDFFFGGKSVFVDHGQGLYTMYFHLSRIDVKEGQEVGRGEVLGGVGATGRATGPHLHWGVRLVGARVDPEALVRATAGSQSSESSHEGKEAGQEGKIF